MVLVRLQDGLLCGLHRLHWRSCQWQCEPGPGIQGRDEADDEVLAASSPQLCRQLFHVHSPGREDLRQANTYMCGTTRSTRKEFPKTLALAYVPQGQSVKWTREDSSVMVCKWHDKCDICMIATNNAGDDEDVPVRRNHQQVVLSTPTCVRDFNQMMGGVDRLVQYRSYYNVGRSGRRWWKYLFWGIFNIEVINSFILWNLANQPLPAKKRGSSP